MEWPLLSDELPRPPDPQGSYVPAVVHGELVMTAGMTPRIDGELQHRGQVGDAIAVDQAREAAAIAAANALSAAARALGPDRAIDRILRMAVYVNAVGGFSQHSAVADGASEKLRALLGDRAAACRVAVGVASLPGDACVELELTCSWKHRGSR